MRLIPIVCLLIAALVSVDSAAQDFSARDELSDPPLHEAIRAGDISAIQSLLQAGADPNAVVTVEGRSITPLGLALVSQAGGEEIRRRRADGSGTADLVLRDVRGIEEIAITGDGRTIVLRSGDGFTGSSDLLWFRVGVDSVAPPLLNSPSREESPAISRDGRWLTYSSDETGQLEVYVRPFPDTDAQRVTVSVNGGAEPRWNAAGDELFFLSAAGDMMAAAVRTAPVFAVTRVNRLFNASGFLSDEVNALYDVNADGQRFLILDITAPRADVERSRIVLVQNFATELMRRLPR